MKPSDLIAQLQEFSRDKLAMLERHVAGARRVTSYEGNNAYQYIINREEAQVVWLHEALTDLGGSLPDAAPALALPSEGRGEADERAVIAGDVEHAKAFLARWQPRVASLSHARLRKVMQVVLGETVEQCRFFEQMLEGRDDVLGRRPAGMGTGGGVLPVRWIKQ